MKKYSIRIAEPALIGREMDYVREALIAGQLSMGPNVAAFEALLSARMGARYAFAVTNGTTALHLSLLALGIKPGDRVVIPACSYVATINAVLYCGAIPILVDVTPDTWTMDPVSTERWHAVGAITVNLYGVPAPIPSRVLWAVEDACESHGTKLAGDVAVLSFYGNKIVTTGEGGAVLTDHDDVAERVRLLRGQGQGPERYKHVTLGYNGRMTDIQAAIGRGQMEKLDEHLRRRATLRKLYDAFLPSDLGRQVRPPGSVDWVVPVLIPDGRRDAVASALDGMGIETRPVFPVLDAHSHTLGKVLHTNALPVARRIAADGLLLPLHLGMNESDVVTVCRVLRSTLEVAA